MAEPETFTIQPRTPPVEINSETEVIECVLRYKLNRRAVALAHFSQEATREKIDEEQKRTWRAEYDNATVDLVQYMLTQYTYLAENNALYVLGMCYHNERLWEEFTKVKGNYDEEAVQDSIYKNIPKSWDHGKGPSQIGTRFHTDMVGFLKAVAANKGNIAMSAKTTLHKMGLFCGFLRAKVIKFLKENNALRQMAIDHESHKLDFAPYDVPPEIKEQRKLRGSEHASKNTDYPDFILHAGENLYVYEWKFWNAGSYNVKEFKASAVDQIESYVETIRFVFPGKKVHGLLVIFPKDDPHKEPIVIETS